MGPKNFDASTDRTEIHQLTDMVFFDTSNINPTDNPVREVKEYFNPALVNVVAVAFEMKHEFSSRILLRAIRNIEPNEEIVLDKGKTYWTYAPTFLRQPKKLQTECKQYYNIADNDFVKAKTNRATSRTVGSLVPQSDKKDTGDEAEDPPTPAGNTRSRGVKVIAKK